MPGVGPGGLGGGLDDEHVVGVEAGEDLVHGRALPDAEGAARARVEAHPVGDEIARPRPDGRRLEHELERLGGLAERALGAPPRGDVADDDAHAAGLAAGEVRDVAAQPVAELVGVAERSALELDVLDGLAGLEHLLQDGLDDLDEKGEQVPPTLADVLLDGQAVDLGQALVDADVAELIVHVGQPHGRRAVDGLDLGELLGDGALVDAAAQRLGQHIGDGLGKLGVGVGEGAGVSAVDAEHAPDGVAGSQDRDAEAAPHAVVGQERRRREPLLGAGLRHHDRALGVQCEAGLGVRVVRDGRLAGLSVVPPEARLQHQITGLGTMAEDLGKVGSEGKGDEAAGVREQLVRVAVYERGAPEPGHGGLLRRAPRRVGDGGAEVRDVVEREHDAVDAVVGRAIRVETRRVGAAVITLDLVGFGDEGFEHARDGLVEVLGLEAADDVREWPAGVAGEHVEKVGRARRVALEAQRAV